VLILRRWPHRCSRIFIRLVPDLFKYYHARDEWSSVQQVAARMMTSLLDSMNHELRTPLASILATAQVLHEEVNPEQRKLTEMLVDSSRRMNHALIQVLKQVEDEHRDVSIAREPVRMADAVSTLLDTHRPRAASRGIDLNRSPIPPDLTIQTDPVILSCVLDFLVDQALRLSNPGEIQLSACADADGLRLEIRGREIVSDLGADPSDDQGLNLTRQMLDRIGGRLDIRCATDPGRSYILSLPNNL
jgi:signal transduction histidine kinase